MSGVNDAQRSRCDVLVSYFRADDAARAEGPGGSVGGSVGRPLGRPVSKLAGRLETVLRRKLADADVRVSMDHPLISEQSTGSGLIAQLDECRVLVLAITPAYLRTHWMREGLRRVIANNKGDAVQIVLAELAPTDRDTWPAAARTLPVVRLFAAAATEAAGSGADATAGAEGGADASFWRGVTDLAHLLSESIRADRAKGSGRPVIVVAEPTPDVRAAHERVVGALRQRHDLAVVAGRPAAAATTDATNAARAQLQNAVAFVQVIGGNPGVDEHALADARDALGAQLEQGLAVLQWRPASIDPARIADDAWRAMATDPRVKTGSLVAFQRDLMRVLDRMPRRSGRSRRSTMIERFASVATPAVPGNGDAAKRVLAGMIGGRRAPEEANGSRVVHVFVQAAAADREMAREVGRQLRYLGVAPVIAPEPNPEASFQRNLEAHDAALRPCQGFVMVCGAAPEHAVRANLHYLLRARPSRPDAMRGAIVDVEPERDRGFVGLPAGVMLLDCPGELHSDVLKPFIEDLKDIAQGELHA